MIGDDKDDKKVIEFPAPSGGIDPKRDEVTKRAREWARKTESELVWWLSLEEHGRKFLRDHDCPEYVFKTLVQGFIKEREHQEADLIKREQERQKRERDRELAEQRRLEAERKAEEAKQQKLKEEVRRLFQKLMKLDDAEQQVELATFAHHKGINPEKLREQFEKHKKVAEEAVPEDETHNPDLRHIEPWPEPVDAVQLMDQITRLERQYLVFKYDAYCRVSALWGVMTWFHHIGNVSPFLCSWSADPDSGKTTLIIFVSGISYRRYYVTTPSEAGVRHDVHRLQPSLFIEEADTLFHKESNPLYSMINASFNKGTVVPRANKRYVPFCPKCFAMKRAFIGLPEAFASRCLSIHMWPKKPGEVVQDLDPNRMVNDPEFLEIRQKIVRWRADNLAAVVKAYGHEKVVMPIEFNNRLQSKWKLLFVLADKIGGDWPKQIRLDALTIESIEKPESEGRQLLEGMFNAFESALKNDWRLSELVDKDRKKLEIDVTGKGRDWIETYELTQTLVQDPESHFQDWKKITRRSLLYLLKHSYQITSRAIHPDKKAEVTIQAYVLDDNMHEVFERSLQKSLRKEHVAYLGRVKRRKK